MEMENIFAQMPQLETERLILRKITMKDAEDMYEYTSQEEVSKYVTWEAHQTLADTKGFIHFAQQKYYLKKVAPWGIQLKQSNKLIGTIDFVSWDPKHKIAEIGYAISKYYWRKGITSEAAEAVIKFGFNNMDLVRIQARCFVENIGSQRVLEKNGFTYEGTMRKAIFVKGRHQDIKLYSILKEELTTNE
ncbi:MULTISPECIES: GNAT family N-acetyltransferase [Bacillus]|uniref:GNAT family N-acetyltransferase n=1 Tax=Bacillus TaxID=1386 RepID=UPI0002F11CDF|nr:MULTISPECIES: GNAT family protein [Bacillus]